MPAIIPFLTGFLSTVWTRLWAFIIFALPWVVEKVLKLLGIGVVTYIGLDVAITQIETYVFNRFDNLGTDLLAIMLLLKLDVGLKIMFSAMAMALTVKAAAGAKRVVMGQGGSLTA